LDRGSKANFLREVAAALGRHQGLVTHLEKLHEVLVESLQKVVHTPQTPIQAGDVLPVLPGSLMIL
jgi:hypothetical protein